MTITKLAFLTAPFLALFITTEVSFAADKILVVDVQRAINESIPGKAARKNVEGEVMKGEARLKELDNELKALKRDLETQAKLLSGEALTQRQQNLRKKERELAMTIQEKQEAIAQKNEKEIGTVVTAVDNAVASIAKEKGGKFVFEKDPTFVVYSKDQIDITEQVIEKVNESNG